MEPLKEEALKSFLWMNWSAELLPVWKDPREVVADPQAHYFGIKVDETTLIPGADARLGEIHLDDWLSPAMSAR